MLRTLTIAGLDQDVRVNADHAVPLGWESGPSEKKTQARDAGLQPRDGGLAIRFGLVNRLDRQAHPLLVPKGQFACGLLLCFAESRNRESWSMPRDARAWLADIVLTLDR